MDGEHTLENTQNWPRCVNCIHFQKTVWHEGFWNRRRERYGCTQWRFMPVSGGIMTNSDPEQMRLTGPCGIEGKLFRKVPSYDYGAWTTDPIDNPSG